MKASFITFLFTLVTLVATAQVSRISNENEPITFLGLDFSKSRFIGDSKRFDSIPKVQKLMESLNAIMDKEKPKYDIGLTIHHKTIIHKIDIAKTHNAALDLAPLLADSLGNIMHLGDNDIAEIVKSYNYGDNQGIGLLFIVESFSKKQMEGWIWVTFMDMQTKEVVLTRRIAGTPRGFGLRNFWAGSVYDVMKKVRFTAYENWTAQKRK